jgi:hypothetical protein
MSLRQASLRGWASLRASMLQQQQQTAAAVQQQRGFAADGTIEVEVRELRRARLRSRARAGCLSVVLFALRLAGKLPRAISPRSQ